MNREQDIGEAIEQELREQGIEQEIEEMIQLADIARIHPGIPPQLASKLASAIAQLEQDGCSFSIADSFLEDSGEYRFPGLDHRGDAIALFLNSNMEISSCF